MCECVFNQAITLQSVVGPAQLNGHNETIPTASLSNALRGLCIAARLTVADRGLWMDGLGLRHQMCLSMLRRDIELLNGDDGNDGEQQHPYTYKKGFAIYDQVRCLSFAARCLIAMQQSCGLAVEFAVVLLSPIRMTRWHDGCMHAQSSCFVMMLLPGRHDQSSGALYQGVGL